MYGTPKLSYVAIFLALSKNCVNLSMHYVIILKTRVVLSTYNVDMHTLSYYVEEPFYFATTWSYLVQ